jgi:hypothetical protein
MSRRKLTIRDKKTQKMSRDGAIERNKATGEDINISKREADYNIRGDTRERDTLSQIGTRSDRRAETANDKANTNKKNAHRHIEQFQEATAAQNEPSQVLQREITSLQEKPKHQTAAGSSKTSKSREPLEPPDDKSSYTPQHQSELSTNLFADNDTSGSVKFQRINHKNGIANSLLNRLNTGAKKENQNPAYSMTFHRVLN